MILWDFQIQTDKIVVVDKEQKKGRSNRCSNPKHYYHQEEGTQEARKRN